MKYLKQLSIILIIACISEVIKTLLPLPIPAGIYGMVLLFILLCTGLIKPKQIGDTSDYLISIMGIMFVPAGVGLLSNVNSFLAMLPAIIVAGTLGTIAVMAVGGKITDLLIRWRAR